MNFFSTLIAVLVAVLVALWLTGNVAAGSILGIIIVSLGWVLAAAGVVAVFAIVWTYCPNPKKMWDDFRTGRLRIW